MDDLIQRLENLNWVLCQSLSNKDKMILAGHTLSGLNLSVLPSAIRQLFEANLLSHNQILNQYDIKTFKDYDKIAPSDMKQLVTNMESLYQDLVTQLTVK